MRVTSIQLDMKERSKEESLAYALSLLHHAPASDLFLLPEIWPCGFFSFDRYRSDSEPVDGPVVRAFQKEAKKRASHILMGSMVEREGDRLFNTSLFLNPKGEIIGRYRKIHLFGYQSRERGLLTPGTDIAVVETPWGKMGLSTCYDLRFPEFYRKMVDLGRPFFWWPLPGPGSAWRHGLFSTGPGRLKTSRTSFPATVPDPTRTRNMQGTACWSILLER